MVWVRNEVGEMRIEIGNQIWSHYQERQDNRNHPGTGGPGDWSRRGVNISAAEENVSEAYS